MTNMMQICNQIQLKYWHGHVHSLEMNRKIDRQAQRWTDRCVWIGVHTGVWWEGRPGQTGPPGSGRGPRRWWSTHQEAGGTTWHEGEKESVRLFQGQRYGVAQHTNTPPLYWLIDVLLWYRCHKSRLSSKFQFLTEIFILMPIKHKQSTAYGSKQQWHVFALSSLMSLLCPLSWNNGNLVCMCLQKRKIKQPLVSITHSFVENTGWTLPFKSMTLRLMICDHCILSCIT